MISNKTFLTNHSYITKILIMVLLVMISSLITTNKVSASDMIPDYIKNEDGIFESRLSNLDNPLLSYIYHTNSSVTSISGRNDNSATLMFTGDLMCLAGQQFAAESKGRYNFYPSYKLVAPIFNSADFVCGNLECLISKSNPITKIQKNIGTAPQCNGPESYLWALRRAGIDCVAMANNHCCDWGSEGIIETEEMLDKYGFGHVGTSKEIKDNFVIFNVKGIKVAILSYTHLINQRGKMGSAEMSKMVSEYSKEKAAADIKSAKDNGADFIVVYCHWGTENTEVLNSYQINDAKDIAEMGADLIIGSHPHCLQGKDIILASDGRKVPCMYSMGNFVSSMVRDINNDTIILRVNISKNIENNVSIKSIDYIPCHVMSLTNFSSFTVVPTQPKFNRNIYSTALPAAESRIRKILGSF